jgi:hypothetical protein
VESPIGDGSASVLGERSQKEVLLLQRLASTNHDEPADMTLAEM